MVMMVFALVPNLLANTDFNDPIYKENMTNPIVKESNTKFIYYLW